MRTRKQPVVTITPADGAGFEVTVRHNGASMTTNQLYVAEAIDAARAMFANLDALSLGKSGSAEGNGGAADAIGTERVSQPQTPSPSPTS